jgi:uncharacterized membrane protein
MIELPMPPEARFSSAMDINDAGVIVGYYYWDTEPNDQWGNESTNAIRWAPGGASYTKLPCCHAGYTQDRDLGSAAYGINEAGVVTGSANVLMRDEPRYGQIHAFTWNGGEYTDLNPVDRDRTSIIGYEINEAGTVAAYGLFGPDRTALINGGSFQIIDINPGYNGLNDAGKVVGERHYQDGKKQIARMWDGDSYVELAPETTPSMANAINNNDWAVGRSGIESYQPGGGTAFLWRPNAPATNLNSLSGRSDIFLETATDINDDDMVTGVAYRYENNQQIGYVMAPAGRAFQLTGKVVDHNGAPVPNVQVRVLRKVDNQPPSAPMKTAADGKYTWTLPPGDYRVTALPEGAYSIALPSADCTIVASFHCDVAMNRNRVADFRGVPPKTTTTTTPKTTTTPPKPTTPNPPVLPFVPVADKTAPVVALSGGSTLRVDRKGALRLGLGRFTEAVKGSVVLKAGKTRLARKSFSAKAGESPKLALKLGRKARSLVRRRKRLKASAVITAIDLAGNETKKTIPLTLRPR